MWLADYSQFECSVQKKFYESLIKTPEASMSLLRDAKLETPQPDLMGPAEALTEPSLSL
jgi:hypothetical protein